VGAVSEASWRGTITLVKKRWETWIHHAAKTRAARDGKIPEITEFHFAIDSRNCICEKPIQLDSH
jgi:hypothetical protein